MENYQMPVLLFVCLLIGCSTETDQRKIDLPPLSQKVVHPPPAGAIGSLQGETCKDWASWCSSYKKYCAYTSVNKYCKETCDLCPKPTPKAECKDIHPSCSIGHKHHYCTGSPNQVDFMKKYCQKSCKFCTTGPDPKNECTDKHKQSYCEEMREQGLCNKREYRLFFKANCQKTCGLCDDNDKCGVAKQRELNNNEVIVGGNDTEKGYFPWQAAIFYESKFICGGTLIDKKNILTAAHCFNSRSTDVRKYKVVLGEHNRLANEDTEETYYVNDIKIHEDYSSSGDDHDITLIQLIRNVELTNFIHPACLPSSGEALASGTKCYITGWGHTSIGGKTADILQELKVPVAERSKCERRNDFNFHKVTDNMICTGFDDGVDYSSACHGDSGGPLSCERSPGVWSVFGVVSWGSPLCNGWDRYTVFTRVSSYIDWIKKNV